MNLPGQPLQTLVRALALVCVWGVLSGAQSIEFGRLMARSTVSARAQIAHGQIGLAGPTLGEAMIGASIALGEVTDPGMAAEMESKSRAAVLEGELEIAAGLLGLFGLAGCQLELLSRRPRRGR